VTYILLKYKTSWFRCNYNTHTHTHI